MLQSATVVLIKVLLIVFDCQAMIHRSHLIVGQLIVDFVFFSWDLLTRREVLSVTTL